MKRWGWLIGLGVAAFALFALATLPAQVALSQLQGAGVQADGISGTVWRGQAQVLVAQGVRVGAVEWDMQGLPLLTGRVAADVKVKRVDGFLTTTLIASPSGRLRFVDLSGSLPLTALPPDLVRGGWSGALNLRLSELALEDGWPVAAKGTVEVIDLTGPQSRPVNMGGYRATFPPEQPAAGVLSAQLTDLGGPLQISGAVQLKAKERSYLIDGLIAARPNAPRDVVNALQFLGAPDEQGRRQFGLEGSL